MAKTFSTYSWERVATLHPTDGKSIKGQDVASTLAAFGQRVTSYSVESRMTVEDDGSVSFWRPKPRTED